MKDKRKVYIADFETTVFEGQQDTEVWASAIVEMFTEDVVISNSINGFFDYIVNLKKSCLIYFHNLKFDGSFIIPFLNKSGYTNIVGNSGIPKKLNKKDFTYMISDRGRWYYIKIKTSYGYNIEIRDSLNLIPFSVENIHKAFETKHAKTSIEYKGFRKPGGIIKDHEKKYIANDVLVVKEAMEYMYNKKLNKMTIGSCCLSRYKEIVSRETFDSLYPDLTEFKIDKDIYGYDNADSYIRKSYHGGFCYVSPLYTGKICHNGITLDVNSLYPSMMESESGNYYPVGLPTFEKGKPDFKDEYYYFLRIKAIFELKEKHLPCIQIKGSFLYPGRKWLDSSDIVIDNKKYKYYTIDGKMYLNKPEMILTETDYKLFMEQYNVIEIDYIDYCYFEKKIGIFDDYIHEQKNNKINAKNNAERTDSKLLQNNLYGKMGASNSSSYKICYFDDNDIMKFDTVEEHEKTVGYIPVGSAITSYARNFTIRAGQKNFKYFRYSDTDSLHLECSLDKVKGVKIDHKEYQCWKHEVSWDKAIFARQKTYIEHVIAEEGELIEKPYHLIKCAGMGNRPKELLSANFDEIKIGKTEEEKDFLDMKLDYKDFKKGLKIPGQLRQKRMKSGVLLKEEYYEMR